ncbi:beta-ketoacyl synthase N-terminal-like domain-containing protein [Jejudonia soesokkakensis]|uniref:Beta-ketoacyl synthase N-terminal-like domain-containing protein n=1 Tax=Jejudonia soesokkakensis TaxID=1323432 RepID=A0ABW2MSM2_9FLAO
MKHKTYIAASAMVTPLGFTTEENILAIQKGHTGIQKHKIPSISSESFYGSLISSEQIDKAFTSLGAISKYTKLEKMMLLALSETLKHSEEKITENSLLLIATTKGNIDALEISSPFDNTRAQLSVLGTVIKDFFGFKNEPIIVSNACVSGILAISVAQRMLQNQSYDTAFIVAGDIVSKFTVSGFQSFQAMSDKPCQPYDTARNGITIGEAATSVVVSKKRPLTDTIEILSGSSCNDANHISGPSRTGEGLFKSISNTLHKANVSATEIDFISAHGTATLFNDEMEAIALNRAGLQKIPLNSLKGYFGHTFGASGLLETAVCLECMKTNTLYTSLGFTSLGVSKPLNIITKTTQKKIMTALKTASGFGGTNTAVLFKHLTTQ